MKLLIIDNSKEAAVIEGTWKNPGASLYDTLLDSFYYKNGKIPNDAKELDQAIKNGEYLQWADYLKEAYLIAPVNKIKNSPYGITPYSRSGCKYPHHVIKNNKLVLSKKGILAAYSRAKQMGIYKGNVKEHIDSHLKELEFDIDDKKLMESVLEENFDDIFNLLNIRKDYFSEDRYFDILHSDLDENHEQKKQRFLSEFHQEYITKALTKKYANDGNLIKYMRDQNPKYDDTCLIWIDDEDNYVCAITFDSKPEDDGHKWISGIDVSYKYRSCGLGKEMVEYAKTQGVDALSVQYDNSVAIKLYRNCGFEISKESKEKVENGSENTYDMFLKKNSLDDNKDSIDIEKFNEMVDKEYQQLKIKNPLSISNFGIIHNEFSIYRDPDFYLKEKASLNAINKLINKGIHKIRKRMNFVTSKKSLAKIQMLDRFDSNKFYDNSCVFGTNIPLLVFKDKINNVRKITESFDDLSQQYYLSESFICESVTEEQIINVRKRLQNELKANIFFLNDKSNMKGSKEIRDMIGPCSVIETNQSTIMKIWTGNDTDLAFIPNRFNSKDLDFERVILVNPEIIMGYPNITERGIELLIKHEYGHILTFDKVSDYDWAEYNLKRNFLNRIIEEISKYSALISVNTNKENINACYLYHHLYPENIADKAVNIDKTDFIRNLHGIDPSMNLYSLNSSKYINYKIPKEILDLVLKEMSLKYLSIEEAKSMSDFYINMCKSLNVPKIIVDGLMYSLSTFENKIQENTIQFVSDHNEEIQNDLEWIDKFVHDELFRESCNLELFEERSHGKLKYDFRFGYDYKTGHQIKIVYSLDNIDILGVGDFYWKCNPENRNRDGSLKMSENEYRDWVSKNITKNGNNDHMSKGQKILSIIDLVTNSKLQSVKLMSPISLDNTEYKFTHYTAIPKNILDIARKISTNKNGIQLLSVGMVDNTPNFKATSWLKNVMDKQSGENLRFNKLSKAEFIKLGRGIKPNDIQAKDFKIWNDNHKYMIYHNPNKKQALNELYMREKDILNYLRSQKEAGDELSQGELNNLRIVQRDINSIQNGKYDLSMMKKYRQFDESTGFQSINYRDILNGNNPNHEEALNFLYALRESIENLISNNDKESNININKLKYIDHDIDLIKSGNYKAGMINKYIEANLIEQNLERFEEYRSSNSDMIPPSSGFAYYDIPFHESYNNLFEEKSHSKLQYCYRIGFDITTGKEVAVQFDLDPSASYLLNKDMIREANPYINKDMENQIYQNGVEKLNKNISKFGHIDFTSSPLKVNAIFTRDGESMNSVKLIPLFSKGIIDLMNKFVQVHKELIIDRKLPSSKELFANPQFQKSIVDSSGTIPYEEYKIGKFSGKEGYGKDKYKTTKLLWDRDLFLSYKYTPVIRGYNKHGRGNNLIDKLNYIDNEMNNKFKESYEGDIDLFNSMVKIKTNHFEEESISGFISGISFYEYTNEGWFRSEDAEDIYFEAVKEYENFLDNLPDKLYFASDKYIGENSLNNFSGNIYPCIELTECFNGKELFNESIQKYFKENYESSGKNYIDNNVLVKFNGMFVHDNEADIQYSHNCKSITEKFNGENDIWVYELDCSNLKLDLFPHEENSITVINPLDIPIIEKTKLTATWNMNYEDNNEIKGTVKYINKKSHLCEMGINESSDPKKHNKYYMEEGENMDQQTNEKPQSMPKQTDAKESSKNGIRRKKLYIAFIEWCKEYNNKNTFGSIFDKDAFNVTYPFVPEEMRYFYRLANPILCVLAGNLTFFQVSELRKLNSKNSKMNEMMIFAATETDFRVFNKKDKKVYRAIDKDGALTLMEPLGATFDIYIQNMIKKGDILNAPLNEGMDFNYSEEDIEEIHENYERVMRESHKELYKAKFIGEWLK